MVTAGRLPKNLTSAFMVGYRTYQAGFIGYLYPEKTYSFHSVCNVMEGTRFVLLTTLTLRKERGGTIPYISASSLSQQICILELWN